MRTENMTQQNAIQIFEGNQVRVAWNEEEEKYYFSIVDIVQILTDSKDVKQYVKRMRARDSELNARWGTICTPTEMTAADGKNYKTQAADLEGIFRIIQSIPSKKAEPIKQVAQSGGKAAKVAREEVEKRIGHSVISRKRASDYLLPTEEAEIKEIE